MEVEYNTFFMEFLRHISLYYVCTYSARAKVFATPILCS